MVDVENSRLGNKITRFLGLVAFAAIVLSSCKSTKTITVVKMKNLSPKRIISKVTQKL